MDKVRCCLHNDTKSRLDDGRDPSKSKLLTISFNGDNILCTTKQIFFLLFSEELKPVLFPHAKNKHACYFPKSVSPCLFLQTLNSIFESNLLKNKLV